jgi:cell division protein FtsB
MSKELEDLRQRVKELEQENAKLKRLNREKLAEERRALGATKYGQSPFGLTSATSPFG